MKWVSAHLLNKNMIYQIYQTSFFIILEENIKKICKIKLYIKF